MMSGANDFSFLNGGNGGVDLSMFDNKKNGFGGNGFNGLTTIAANPMYTSFGDPAMDPMAWASFGPNDYLTNGAGGTGASPASASGGYGVNPFDTTSGATNNQIDINGVFGIPSSYGNAYAATMGGAPYGALGSGSTDDMFAGVGGATPSFLDFNARSSPVGTSVVGSGSGGTYSDIASSVVPAEHDPNADGEGCPKSVEDVKRLQAVQGPPSTFGKAPSPGASGTSSSPLVLKSIPLGQKNSSSVSLSSASSINSPVTPPQSSSSIALQASSSTSSLPSTNTAATNPNRLDNKELEKDHACAHARMAALCADLPRTSKKPNQIEIGRAWEKIRQIPTFEVCFSSSLSKVLWARY